MKNYKEVIEKNIKDSSFYLPIIGLLENSKTPLSIKEVARLLKITYAATKPRLHKLHKWNLIQRLKRGYYWLPKYCEELIKIPTPQGELFFLNGCIRVMGAGNGIWITIYNSKFGEKNNRNYCIIESFKKDTCIIRKNNEFNGNKLYLLKSKSVGISISRRDISDEILGNLSTKVIPVKIGIYPEEWNISIRELFSTESKEDGELAEELNKFGEIKKPTKFNNLKADIIFSYKNKKVPIEVTNTKPLDNFGRAQYRKSSIKASQIIMRLYFSIKWNFLNGLPTILIIHKDWGKQNWILEEQKFMKNFEGYILLTDFKEGWAKQTAQEIKRLTESSRFNKKTLLRSS